MGSGFAAARRSGMTRVTGFKCQIPTTSTTMEELAITVSAGRIAAGEAYLADTPVLRSHAGTQPDLFLRWNAMRVEARSVDVVVHLHGFSQQGGSMALSEKVGRSGLDLSRRARPTLALLPRGNWIRHT